MHFEMAPTLYNEEPEPGDLIEIFRRGYQHWAVYVDHGFVVHLVLPSEYAGAGSSSSCSRMSLDCKKATVKKEQLSAVVGTDRWKINNSLGETSRPTDDIVKEANELVGSELPYSIIFQNCEHFVNKLRYGKAVSWQVFKVIAFLFPHCWQSGKQKEAASDVYSVRTTDPS